METVLNQTFEIIKDYRSDEDGRISKELIGRWIEQFDEEDRKFLLSELNHVLKLRYASKDDFINYFRNILFKDIASLAKQNFGLTDLKEIFQKLYFIDQQPVGKSQKIILGLLGEVLLEEFGIDISTCGKNEAIAIVYLDDILCTGDTLFKGIDNWLQKSDFKEGTTNKVFIEENKLPLISVFYAVHTLNMHKVRARLKKKYDKLELAFIWEDDHEIDNDYKNQNNSALQYLFPKQEPNEELIEACRIQIEEKIDKHCDENNYARTDEYFYRSEKFPVKETMFTSSANRDRFEKIILLKSIELYNLANSEKTRMRPLGNGLVTDKSFGFGTLFFTWRNVPFNTPLVFWYEHKGWIPLFKRNYTEYGNSSKWDDFLKQLFA